MRRINVIDSHTEGEPTRVIVGGGPELGGGPIAGRLDVFREQHDRFRRAVVNEPRGSDVIVGALLCEPCDPGCATAVIFFNNVGFIGMCGHGTIGVVTTLLHLGRLAAGESRIETSVGVVTCTLHPGGAVSVASVPSYRKARAVTVHADGIGEVTGDVAWGGNWFFIVESHGQRLDPANVGRLTDFASRIRQAVNAQGFLEVDHIELSGPPASGGDSRNFVLCPGNAYDRSPCGTGTGARLACLAADGRLDEDAPWVQEGIIGGRFTGRYRWLDRAAGIVAPVITGTAHITAEATLILGENDPFCWGLRPSP